MASAGVDGTVVDGADVADVAGVVAAVLFCPSTIQVAIPPAPAKSATTAATRAHRPGPKRSRAVDVCAVGAVSTVGGFETNRRVVDGPLIGRGAVCTDPAAAAAAWASSPA